jgi:hypothetical protein
VSAQSNTGSFNYKNTHENHGIQYNNNNKKEPFMFIKPTPPQAFLAECFDYSPDTGALTWKARPRTHFLTESKWKRHLSLDVGREAGTLNANGYRVVRLTHGGTAGLFPVHRVIWALLHAVDASVVDHINGNRSDNRRANLRELSQSENVRKKAPVKAGLRGAHYDKVRGKWLSQIRIDGRQQFLGRFDTEQEAHEAYLTRLQTLKDTP